jgi:hypothetical protein
MVCALFCWTGRDYCCRSSMNTHTHVVWILVRGVCDARSSYFNYFGRVFLIFFWLLGFDVVKFNQSPLTDWSVPWSELIPLALACMHTLVLCAVVSQQQHMTQPFRSRKRRADGECHSSLLQYTTVQVQLSSSVEPSSTEILLQGLPNSLNAKGKMFINKSGKSSRINSYLLATLLCLWCQ